MADEITPTLNGYFAVMDWNWTSDSSGDAVAYADDLVPGVLYAVATVPGTGGSQPSDNYDVVIQQQMPDVAGTDVVFTDDIANSLVLNRDNTNEEVVTFWPTSTLTIAGKPRIVISNAGNTKSGRLKLLIYRTLAKLNAESTDTFTASQQIYSPQMGPSTSDADLMELAANLLTINGDATITGTLTAGGISGSGETNTASNVGTDGVGVFKQKTGVDFEFRHVAPASSKVTVVNNSDDIDIDVVEAQIDHDALANFSADEHRTINDAGSAATDLWSADKITTELSGKAASSHTHATSDVTSGTFADARVALSNVNQHMASLTSEIRTSSSYLVIGVGGEHLFNAYWDSGDMKHEFLTASGYASMIKADSTNGGLTLYRSTTTSSGIGGEVIWENTGLSIGILNVPVAGLWPTTSGGGPAPALDANDHVVCAFDGASDESYVWQVCVPPDWDGSSTFIPVYAGYLSSDWADGADTVELDSSIRALNNSEAMNASYGTAITTTKTWASGETTDELVRFAGSGITPSGTPTAGGYMNGLLTRTGTTDGSGGDFNLTMFYLLYTRV